MMIGFFEGLDSERGIEWRLGRFVHAAAVSIHWMGREHAKDKTVGVDSTTLQANAAMKSIVRRDMGESYNGVARGSRTSLFTTA
jgi:hypothetical protein